jgi:predicted nucleic acid-binding protein
MILADTSGLLCLYNSREPNHEAVRTVVADERGPLVVSPYVIAELDYLVATRWGVTQEAQVLAELSMPAYTLATIDRDDLQCCVEVVKKYADKQMGVTDASIVVLAERMGIDRVLTLDRRHFEAVRTRSGGQLTLLP